MKKLIFVFLIIISNLFAEGPDEPYNPMTAPGAMGISFWSHTLIWQNPINVVFNKVYFGSDITLVTSLDTSVLVFDGFPNNSISEHILNSSQLNPYTKYYWCVVEFDSNDFKIGPIWYFTTLPHPSFLNLLEDDFTALTDNWVINNDGGTCVWETVSRYNNNYTLPPESEGNVFVADADDCGSGSSTLTSATIRLPLFQGYSFMEIEWDNDWQAINNSDSGLVQISTDNDLTWQTIRTFDVVDVRNTHEILSYNYSTINDSFSIRFKSIQPGWDWWWAIDNLSISLVGPLSPSYPPGLLRAQADSTVNGVYLSWTQGSSPNNINGYRIQRRNGLPTDTSSYITLILTNSTTLNFIDQNIEVNKNYTYRIQTISGPGSGSMWGNEATAYVPSIIPVELTSITSSVIENNVTLNWQTATETNNQGFQIERRKRQDERIEEWNLVSFVNGYGTTTEPQSYSFVDENMVAGKYQYRLKQVVYDGTFKYSKIIEVEVGTPTKFSLYQNFPNPFNPSTTISYQIPKTANVTIKAFDILGREVATLVNEEKPAGNYEVKFDASNIASGIYYYQIKTGKFVQTRKMILLK